MYILIITIIGGLVQFRLFIKQQVTSIKQVLWNSMLNLKLVQITCTHCQYEKHPSLFYFE